MSQTKKNIMTYEGIKKLEEELEYLKTVRRKEITEKISEINKIIFKIININI